MESLASAFGRQNILYAVTDRKRLAFDERALIIRVGWLATAGIDLIQIRERDLPDRALAKLTRDAVAAVAGTSTRVLVNDRADVAVAAGAHGVHLRGDSVAPQRVRAWAPTPFVIGRSVHAIDEALSAETGGGCDFLLFGTVFPSRGKPPAHATTGVEGLRAACAAVSLRVCAIGGIDVRRAADAAAAGARGVAGVDVFFSVRDEGEARTRVAEVRRVFDSRSRLV